MLPLAVEFETKVVALAMDDSGMPNSVADRWRALDRIFAATDKAGLPRDRVFIDPLIRPVSTNPEQVAQGLDMIRDIKARAGGAGTVCGLSNISFGLPMRRHLNRTFLAMAAAAGLSAAILDPTEPDLMPTVLAAACLTGEDAYCMNYITAQRQNKL
jgi:5-methyltetrahydrofolate--homocysteine methyltransferase